MQKQVLFLAVAVSALSQTGPPPDPAYADLDKAYQALQARQYDRAIAGFERVLARVPDRPSVRKDLAYTWLKVGETGAARDQFAEAMRLDPLDTQVALEYAFLCYETHQEITARRIFERYRKSNATAAQAFENIDRPLRDGIERWKQALAISPENFSGHQELARSCGQLIAPALAAIPMPPTKSRSRPHRIIFFIGLRAIGPGWFSSRPRRAGCRNLRRSRSPVFSDQYGV